MPTIEAPAFQYETVIIGGGGGASRIAAAAEGNFAIVVPVTDDGGSTGELRRYGCAVGDIRRNIGAIAANSTIGNMLNLRLPEGAAMGSLLDAEERFRAALTPDALRYDYSQALIDLSMQRMREVAIDLGGEVGRHTLGNLMLAGYLRSGIDISNATRAVSMMVGTRATVIPATTGHNDKLFMFDGYEVIEGEHRIDTHHLPDPNHPGIRVWLSDGARLNPIAHWAIAHSRRVIFAPGSRNSSKGALQAIPGMAEALQEQGENGGQIFAVTNLINEQDTRRWTDSHHTQDMQHRLPHGRRFDGVIYNDRPHDIPYGLEPVLHDPAIEEELGVRARGAPLVGECVIADPNDTTKRSAVAHDAHAALHAVSELCAAA